ncbi:hypothetical protein [Bradyrhizobium sp. RDT46]|uniref:hypothetical protein n=1 Tax=Bradyrhizobium sp. RDT46 TaxID=3341829 RepID=UPI0035C6C84C
MKSEKLSILVMCALKLAAMPTGANADIFAVQHQRLVNPASGAVALGTLLAAVTPVVALGDAVRRRRFGRRPCTASPAPKQQSAQAEEREHRSNYHDQPDNIDDTVHSSAPSAFQSCRSYKHPRVWKGSPGPAAVFWRKRGTKTSDPARPPSHRAVVQVRFAFARKGR